MREYLKFYSNGEWVPPACPNTLEVINPANETVAGRICLASALDVERAVKAAHDAFPGYGGGTDAPTRFSAVQTAQGR